MSMLTYRDFASGKIKKTRGKFIGWTKPQGALSLPYAVFQNRSSDLLVPQHCVTAETMSLIPPYDESKAF